MKTIRFLILSAILIALFMPLISPAEDLNDIAYESRVHLKAGTIWNYYGIGDCLIFPYYDVRKVGESRQVTAVNIENFGEYGVAAKFRVRDWARGSEIFSRDIWIPSKTVWYATVEMSEDGSNAVITSAGNVVWRFDSKTFYFTNSLLHGVPFSTRNIRKGRGESTLYGFIEVIGEEKTSPDGQGGKTMRLAQSERDCPNTLRGTVSINRVEEGTTVAYDGVAIGNFSRGQGSLFRKPGSPYPVLSNSEDTLDQLEFQLSKWEVFGPFSVTPSNAGKTSLIVTFPTKFFHYKGGRRIDQINNPFEAPLDAQGETLKTSLSSQGAPLPADAEITLPFSVNVIGLYQGSGSSPAGIDNLSLPTFSYESGDVKLTSDDKAQRILIQDYEYFKEMFTGYTGLPALGLILQENRNPGALAAGSTTKITPADFSAVWEKSAIESILSPTSISGPGSGVTNTDYTYTAVGAASTIGDPIQIQFDWGDGSLVDDTTWLSAGATSAAHNYAQGGFYVIYARARCAIHTNLVSKWSKGFLVVIEAISPPLFLTGPVIGLPNVPYTYTTGGAATVTGDPVQYFFDWGDNTDSNWLPVGVTTATKTWIEGGNYNVTAKARSAANPLMESASTSPLVVRIEKITAPQTPVGPTKGLPNDLLTFMTGGASSNTGDPIEYRFDWGDGTFSAWSSTPSASKSWSVGANYKVRAQARCAIHTSIVSAWSSELTVAIEFISKPGTPQGPIVGIPFNVYTYTAGGAVSNIGDPVQYRFDWGDGTQSDWITPDAQGKATAGHVWQFGATFNVTVKARCALHTFIESVPSDILAVDIETVSAPNQPTSPDLPPNPTPPPDGIGVVKTDYNFSVDGGVSNIGSVLEYQFEWGDGTPPSAWLTPGAGGAATAKHQWAQTGTYSVRARARSKTQPAAISNLSPPFIVQIN